MNPLGGHKMAQMPVKKLLLNMGTPMMISMLGQALYNVVDTFFVSHIPDTAAVADMGDKAINALTLAWALSMLPNAADVIWAALPIAEAGACAAAVILTKNAYKAAM